MLFFVKYNSFLFNLLIIYIFINFICKRICMAFTQWVIVPRGTYLFNKTILEYSRVYSGKDSCICTEYFHWKQETLREYCAYK